MDSSNLIKAKYLQIIDESKYEFDYKDYDKGIYIPNRGMAHLLPFKDEDSEEIKKRG